MLNVLSMTVKKFADFVRDTRRDKGLSLKKVEEQSGYNDLTEKPNITGSYVNQLENDLIPAESLSLEKLKSLAKGLRVSIDEMFFAAIGKDFEDAPFEKQIKSLLVGVDKWDSAKQKDLLYLLQIFIIGMHSLHSDLKEDISNPFKHTDADNFDNDISKAA